LPRVSRRNSDVYAGSFEDVGVDAWRGQGLGFERDFILRAVSGIIAEIDRNRDGQRVELDKPGDPQFEVHRE